MFVRGERVHVQVSLITVAQFSAPPPATAVGTQHGEVHCLQPKKESHAANALLRNGVKPAGHVRRPDQSRRKKSKTLRSGKGKTRCTIFSNRLGSKRLSCASLCFYRITRIFHE